MEKIFSKVEELADNAKEYVNVSIESVKMNVAERSSAVISNLMAGIVVAIVFIFFILFASIAAAFGLGKCFGETWIGFLIVAGFYLLVGIVVWFTREKIIRLPIMNAILQQLFKSDEDNDKEDQ